MSVEEAPTPTGPPGHPTDHAHPGPFEYIKVAGVLGFVTAIEVAVYYMSGLRTALVPILITLSVVKFALVGLYFMHLKFDTRMFSRLFAAGIVLALIVYSIAIVTLFKYR
jgi:cytochrome c oxidase subunit 4